MPEIPRAQQRVQTPQRAGSPDYTVNSRVTAPYLRKIGQQLTQQQRQAQQIWDGIKKDRDVAQAHDAIYKFEDAARSKYAELRSLEGGNAVELSKQYDEWFQNASMDAEETLTGNNQRTIFHNAAISRRGRDMDSLSAHEMGQHKIYMDSIYNSRVAGAKKDAALYSDDPVRVERMIIDAQGWADVAKPGEDNTVRKQAIADDVMAISIMTQAERNPQKAKAMLERWRPRLGAKALELSKDVDKEFLYFEARTRFKDDFNQQYDWVKGMKNVDEDVKRAVMGRINSDEAEVEERERRALAEHTRSHKTNDIGAWREFYAGRMTREKLDSMAELQSISTGAYKGIMGQMTNPTQHNDPIEVGEIAEMIAMGQDPTAALDEAISSGKITTQTYVSMKSNAAKKDYQGALNYVSDAMKPPQFYYNPDKALKYAEAIRSFDNRVSAGENPARVASDIVKNNTADIRRTSIGLAIPSYLQGGKAAALNIDALETAKFETASAFERGEITSDEYRYQIELIDQRMDLALESEQSSGVDSAELQEALKKAEKLNN